MIEKIFNGRNGLDAFSAFLILLAMPFTFWRYTLVIAAALIAYALFRAFSRNVGKRREELWKFQGAAYKVIMFFRTHFRGIKKFFASVKSFFSYYFLKIKNRKTTLYFRCPKCKNILSLPRHKGKLAVTCPVCHQGFIKKT